MSLASTMVLYLMLGAGVTSALFVREGLQDGAGVFRLAAAWAFWPLYVPVLLGPGTENDTPVSHENPEPATPNPILAEIARVESELAGALRTLDGWAEGALAVEGMRFIELKNAWRVQAHRIHELGELLESSGDDGAEPTPAGESPAIAISHSLQARRENIDRLRHVHRRMHDDLLGNLARVRELVTLIHLAKYTGAPASRTEELVAQIAAAVEGLSEVSDWRSTEVPAAGDC